MPNFDFLAARTERALRSLEDAGLRRVLRPPSGIDLSSNDYLGLSSHPRLIERMAAAVREWGCGSTGSRLLRGERECFDRIERRFAAWKGVERALYFSSGYLANLAAMTAFTEPGDVVYSDRLNHASLIDGLRLSSARRVVFPHRDVGRLAELMAAEPTAPKFVVTESLFSMDGDLAPLADYAALCRQHGAALLVDEAHAVGVFGASGSGLIEAAGISEDVFVSINTAGKALGVSGAFVCGPEWAIDFLVQRARPFIFSTAAPPAVAAAIDAALDLVASEPERRVKVLNLSKYLRGRLSVPGCSQIVPFLLGENERALSVAESLQREGFDVRAIRPPSVPEGTARVRIAINANLTEAILDRFVDLLCAASS